MKNIEIGHKISFLVEEGKKYGFPSFDGVVYKIIFRENLNNYVVYVKSHKSLSFSAIVTSKLEYSEKNCFIYNGKVSESELKTVQGQMARFSSSSKAPVKRGGIEIDEKALLEPNKDYFGHYIEGYIKTKKVWKQIIRTTAKMAFFDGGKCSINNVEKVRQMK